MRGSGVRRGKGEWCGEWWEKGPSARVGKTE